MTKPIDRSRMTRAEAHAVLDCVRDGDDEIPAWSIYLALHVLGDCDLPEYPIIQITERGSWEGRLGRRPASWFSLIE
jgi:hypothetical protein